MSDNEARFIVGAKRNPDGTWDYSRAATIDDKDGSWARAADEAAKNHQEDRKKWFKIPKDAQPGTAQRVWYELRNSRLVQEEAKDKNPNDQRAEKLIASFRLKQALLSDVEDRMWRELRDKMGAVDTTPAGRNSILYASALRQEAVLSEQITLWEDEAYQNPSASTSIGVNRYPIASVLPAARELSLQLLREAENYKLQEIPVPENWTYLVHGSNLDNAQWKDEGGQQLHADILEVKGMGLSTIDKADRDERQRNSDALKAQGVAVGGYDTTRDYAQGTGTPLEIRVVFPAFHSRHPLLEEARAKLVEKYGEVKVKALYDLADMVQWKNHQGGRHPLLPKGMTLIRVMDQTLEGQGRVVQYVPEILLDIYQQETGKTVER